MVKAAVKGGYTEAEWKQFKEKQAVRKLHLSERTIKKQYKAKEEEEEEDIQYEPSQADDDDVDDESEQASAEIRDQAD